MATFWRWRRSIWRGERIRLGRCLRCGYRMRYVRDYDVAQAAVERLHSEWCQPAPDYVPPRSLLH